MLVHEGSGALNSLIDKLPFEVHIPGGYQYCGPGTKLQKRLARGDSGINPLDAACREHDIAYSQSKDLDSRHKADAVLAERAWQRVKARDSGFGEKAAAWAVTNAMKAKRTLGMGAPARIKTLGAITGDARVALKNARPKTLDQAVRVALAAARKSVKRAGGRANVKIPRIIPIPKSGGLLPLLPALFGGLAALGTLAGGSATVAKTVTAAKNAREKLEEMKRHNEKMEAIALGRGIFLTKRKSGYGLYLGKKPKNR